MTVSGSHSVWETCSRHTTPVSRHAAFTASSRARHTGSQSCSKHSLVMPENVTQTQHILRGSSVSALSLYSRRHIYIVSLEQIDSRLTEFLPQAAENDVRRALHNDEPAAVLLELIVQVLERFQKIPHAVVSHNLQGNALCILRAPGGCYVGFSSIAEAYPLNPSVPPTHRDGTTGTLSLSSAAPSAPAAEASPSRGGGSPQSPVMVSPKSTI
ncbi:hypothetical protein RR46_14360 [Papilio xuthus]|uniref:Uncharacterized protein n=1 Tax=Papilio xuthus TaxID=66420 RepID=A0A194PK83_PAPXU|nr:hypothetical protein RR46_14360 [Papilio xuthus]